MSEVAPDARRPAGGALNRKPPRRRNVDRSAATRKLILDATVRCLFERGFGAVTNHTVADLAGVSRGAMMHHFPTRQALLVATVGHCYARLREQRLALMAKLEPGLPRFRALIDLAWSNAQTPEDIACNEIRMGSRSDPAIAAAITPIMIQVGDDFARYIGGLAREAGLRTDAELKGLTVTTAMAIRATAVNRFTYPRPHMADSVLHTLKAARENLIARQLGVAAADPDYLQDGRRLDSGERPAK